MSKIFLLTALFITACHTAVAQSIVARWSVFNLTPALVNSSVSSSVVGGNATVTSSSTIDWASYSMDNNRSLNTEQGLLTTRMDFDDFYATNISFSITGLQAPGVLTEIQVFDRSNALLTTSISATSADAGASGIATSGTTASWNFDDNALDFLNGIQQNLDVNTTGDVSAVVVTFKVDPSHKSGFFNASDDFRITAIRSDSFTAVPEPSAALLLGFGMLTLGLRRVR
jgi:hypothetical protein